MTRTDTSKTQGLETYDKVGSHDYHAGRSERRNGARQSPCHLLGSLIGRPTRLKARALRGILAPDKKGFTLHRVSVPSLVDDGVAYPMLVKINPALGLSVM
ncbi:hypothetical protein RRG08_027038 [Elysia crispata]|uniref:Uncharacterized protein n=1 Tax=Elysia crispata TaxID=231223 RepID=A0AAE1DHB4_9GAST|nr:hypothetical protein RRG08_027038 [Elysia crispata]